MIYKYRIVNRVDGLINTYATHFEDYGKKQIAFYGHNEAIVYICRKKDIITLSRAMVSESELEEIQDYYKLLDNMDN